MTTNQYFYFGWPQPPERYPSLWKNTTARTRERPKAPIPNLYPNHQPTPLNLVEALDEPHPAESIGSSYSYTRRGQAYQLVCFETPAPGNAANSNTTAPPGPSGPGTRPPAPVWGGPRDVTNPRIPPNRNEYSFPFGQQQSPSQPTTP